MFVIQAFDALLQKLQKYVPYGASVADLYAGAGAIGLSLAVSRKCRQAHTSLCAAATVCLLIIVSISIKC